MKNYNQRINNIKGQLNGIAKMIEVEDDTYKVLIQMKAARSACNSMMRMYMQENFYRLMTECQDKEQACQRFFDELIN